MSRRLLLALLLTGCEPLTRREAGTWTRIPSPNGYTDVECYIWDDNTSTAYNGPVCLVIPRPCPTKD